MSPRHATTVASVDKEVQAPQLKPSASAAWGDYTPHARGPELASPIMFSGATPT